MPYKRKCVQCDSEFDSQQPHTKSCSLKCRNEMHARVYGRYSELGIATGTVGAISELIAGADLMKKGYSVFRALSPACYADIVALKNKKQYSFEVRTGYLAYNGKLSFPKGLSKDQNGDIDFYAVVLIGPGIVRYFTTTFEEVTTI
jgi:hypothetical protein